jgi:hypothetical protein
MKVRQLRLWAARRRGLAVNMRRGARDGLSTRAAHHSSNGRRNRVIYAALTHEQIANSFIHSTFLSAKSTPLITPSTSQPPICMSSAVATSTPPRPPAATRSCTRTLKIPWNRSMQLSSNCPRRLVRLPRSVKAVRNMRIPMETPRMLEETRGSVAARLK